MLADARIATDDLKGWMDEVVRSRRPSVASGNMHRAHCLGHSTTSSAKSKGFGPM
jgi:hypothetical protein